MFWLVWRVCYCVGELMVLGVSDITISLFERGFMDFTHASQCVHMHLSIFVHCSFTNRHAFVISLTGAEHSVYLEIVKGTTSLSFHYWSWALRPDPECHCVDVQQRNHLRSTTTGQSIFTVFVDHMCYANKAVSVLRSYVILTWILPTFLHSEYLNLNIATMLAVVV